MRGSQPGVETAVPDIPAPVLTIPDQNPVVLRPTRLDRYLTHQS